jgi:hypothetical protein
MNLIFIRMKAITANRFRLYLSLSILTGTLGLTIGAGLVTQADATTAPPVCSDIASQTEPIQRSAETIAENPSQTVEVLTSLVQSTVDQTVQCLTDLTPTTNSGTK